ncbi:MAG: AraC family transcriptional regulator [Chloroflexota bacterium]|nr:AraC family transcriptional regulator [Chloroflexota bacterium]
MEPEIGKPRGILLRRAGEKRFQLTRLPPSQDLSCFVERYWIVSWDLRDQPPYVQETLPYPCVNLVIEKDRSMIYGVETGKFARLLEGHGRVFGVKFKPGAFYPFFKAPVVHITNACISFQAALGVDSNALEEALLAHEDENAMKEVVEGFLLARLPKHDAHVMEINRIIDYIIAHQEITRVDDVVEQLALNKRTLQRLFNQYVGVGPKWVIKRYRLHEVAERLAAHEGGDCTKLAQDLGYFDQAHFIKDFKTVVGKTPSEYARDDRD